MTTYARVVINVENMLKHCTLFNKGRTEVHEESQS